MKVVEKICFLAIGFLILLVMGTASPCLATDEEALVTEIDIKPETLNLKSKGNWVTVFVEPPEGYEAEDIIADSVVISAVGGTITNIEPVRSNLTDSDDDGVNELKLKYSRGELQSAISQSNLTGQVEVTLTGTLSDTKTFMGSDTIRIKGFKE
jgi:hypothetical protein